MQEEASVLLLSVGESPAELKSELERLKVRVIEGEFLDAEEKIEEQAPDLVVLAGGRGAMELATLLDDQEGEHRARMVIVAERKELAKLRGLNREVVISLFALETTEKVVAQRVESLARRAARRRAQAQGGAQTVPKKTSLGLPSGKAVVGQLALKKKEVPSPPATSTKEPAPATKELVEEPEELDEELVSLPPSIAPDEEVTTEVKVPTAGRVPLVPEGEGPVSSPPTLPPEAKAAGGKRTPAPPAEEGLDISDAEDALENLDSQKAAITPELLKEAQKIAEAQPVSHGPLDSETTPVSSDAAPDDASQVAEAIDSLGGLGTSSSEDAGTEDAGESDIQELGESAFLDIDSVFDGATKKGAVKGEPQGPIDTADESEVSGKPPMDSESAQEGDESEPSENLTADVETEPEPVEEVHEQSAPSAPESPPASAVIASISPESEIALPKKASSGKGFLLVALACGAVGGAYAGGVFDAKPAGDAPGEEAVTAAVHDEKEAETAPPSHAASASEKAAKPATEADEETLDSPASVEQTQEVEAPAEASPTASVLSNPFLEEDTKRPACEQLVAKSPIEADADPVQQASLIWNEARKAIVSGKLEEAHLKMCQAVTLNPESAAIEGLATLYLREKSSAEALRWADKAEQLRPGQSEIGYVRGDIYSLMGKIEKAREIWLHTLNIPAEETARIQAVSRDYSVEAGRHLRRGDLVRAQQWFRRAVILDPDNIGGIIGLAKAFHRAEMPKYARAFCEMSLKVSDEIPEVHVMLGELALADDDREGARVRFERALAVRPDFFPAKRGLAQLKE